MYTLHTCYSTINALHLTPIYTHASEFVDKFRFDTISPELKEFNAPLSLKDNYEMCKHFRLLMKHINYPKILIL